MKTVGERLAVMVLGITLSDPPATLAPALTTDRAEFQNEINLERKSCSVPPVAVSAELCRLAQQRADEIGASVDLDFEPVGSTELLDRATAAGYSGRLVQELVAVDEGSPCEIVNQWNHALQPGEIYRRHEVRDIGIGEGMLGQVPIHVLIVGVPSSNDPLRRRTTGVAPREYLTADLFDLVNDGRRHAGVPPFRRDAALDREAQQRACELLADSRVSVGRGSDLTKGVGRAVFFKGLGLRVARPNPAVELWFEQDRSWLVQRGEQFAGVGLASRGSGDQVEAVWVLMIGSRLSLSQ